MSLKVRPVPTYLKYLRSIHLPEGLSRTTSVSKTVRQSSTVSAEASITETVEAGIGGVEDSTDPAPFLGAYPPWAMKKVGQT